MARVPIVDQEACISCNLCVDLVPEVFRLNSDGLAETYDPTGAPEEKIQDAIDNCPVNCIAWED
ncbi:ferredoxin [Geoalkalibacter ferrihydriticus]|uniref:Ferredoxin n=2 Tax=Geoalkalibacter ferrihydriticus TaxID=392333 RepID=A0A0C2HGB4_9BACT|nr:ferredoxin [Geoalkalibacter ferrihydriticus]KIH75976.1 ferredoxin [Geoalkalibacter ferrihydriticus DSM 17813]SDM58026.1 ferredoxin [Geoalkalibacter ferrihydriticus]